MSRDDAPAPVGSFDDRRRFGGLSFEDYRRLAVQRGLTANERAGFPAAFRAGYEETILADIAAKLPALQAARRTVVDIGPGASDLSRLLLARCVEREHDVTLVDSAEMLAHIDDAPRVTKVPARFPDCAQLLERLAGRADAILAYSVIQSAFVHASVFAFLDAALGLLAPGGRLLVGDVPNASMRRRFMASAAGAAYHRTLSGRDEDPPVRFAEPSPGEFDDAALLGLAARARAAGFHAWIVAQDPGLAFANRREDLLVHRP
jgi:hypothetical protein